LKKSSADQSAADASGSRELNNENGVALSLSWVWFLPCFPSWRCLAFAIQADPQQMDVD
jgi:hypothetical protein